MSSVYFDPAVGGDGSTVSDDSNSSTGLASGGHRTRFVPALSQVVSLATFAKGRATAADGSAIAAAGSATIAEEHAAMASDAASDAAISSGLAQTKAEEAVDSADSASASAVSSAASAEDAAALAAAYIGIVRQSRTSNTSFVLGDSTRLFDLSGTFTQTLTASATLGAGWHVYLRNASNGNITIDPDGSELISGALTYVLKPGYSILLTCDGVAFNVLELKTRTYQNCIQYTSSGSFVVPADMFALRAYAFGAGAAGTTTASGAGGGCAFGDIPVTPGETVTLTIAAGVATVINQSITRLTGSPASGITAGTASKHASVTNGGAYVGGPGYTSASGGGASGSPLGAGGIGGGGWGSSGNSGGGGGCGGSATTLRGGKGLIVPSTDPLLFGLNGLGGASNTVGNAESGQSGGGGGSTFATSSRGGDGGFGGGGGDGYGTSTYGGAGGFGGGGGGAVGVAGAGGIGGGGGGKGGAAGGAGGAAVIRIYY